MARAGALLVLAAIPMALLFTQAASPGMGGEVECRPAVLSDGAFAAVLSAPAPIPDNEPIAGLADCIAVADTRAISDLNVHLAIDHSWVGDLIVTLTHDDTGRSVRLLDRPGAVDESSGCDGDDIDATLDDEASSPAHDECAATTPTISGSFRPATALSVFDGESIAGTWTLEVTDNAPRDSGALSGWSLIAELRAGPPPPTPTPGLLGDAGCDGAVNSIDATLVLQLDAGLIDSLACAENGDVNGDRSVNSLDAALILQFDAGLIGSLGPG